MVMVTIVVMMAMMAMVGDDSDVNRVSPFALDSFVVGQPYAGRPSGMQ